MHEYASRVELPGAPDQPWIVKDETRPAGEVRHLRYESKLLGNERDLWIYTPPSHGRNQEPAALLLVFDGRAYIDYVPTPTILDNLSSSARIPPTVAVLIGNPSQAARNAELPPNEAFAGFLAKELIPWIRGRYNVTEDPQLTIAAGSSFGCLAAANAALRHSTVFGKILCQSGAFWWAPDHKFRGAENAITETNWLAKQFRDSPKLPLSFYLDAGVFEVDTTGSGGVILEPTRHFRDVLLAKGYRVTYQQFVGGHDYLSWRNTFAEGLIALLGVTE